KARVLHSVGEIQKRRGNLQVALGHFQDVLEITRSFDDRYSEAMALMAIAQVNTASGDTEQGLKFANQALKILRKIGADQEAGMVAESIKRAEESLEQTQKKMTDEE
ncbi:MAG: tetratricopeptide repeat protein, partial [Candidatus Zixiibacteriota bacterium]